MLKSHKSIMGRQHYLLPSALAGLLVEIVLTFVFVLAILGVTSKKAGHGSFGGLVGAAIAAVVYKNLES